VAKGSYRSADVAATLNEPINSLGPLFDRYLERIGAGGLGG